MARRSTHARPQLRSPIDDLDELPFDNRFTRELPGDPNVENRPRQVAGALYSRVQPTPMPEPRTLAWSSEMAQQLGLDPQVCEGDDFALVFSGSRVPAGADPFAMTYGGHQFGTWAGQLGDGRAIALGEVLDVDGRHQTLQLKGSGLTPYSRTADGRAVLRSSLREFLCSEAMHHLGVPTTRALSIVTTGEQVVRDMFYDGNPQAEPGAVVCRVAPSFVRFGSLQLPAARGELELLRALVDFTIRNDFPELQTGPAADDTTIARWFDEVCTRTALLLVDWMRVGFVHGVLNTDNMSILGLTIDYGPYGWLESFDPLWTPNTTDAHGRRYRYGAQPQVAQWNLLQLANALLQLTRDTAPLEQSLERYAQLYQDRFDQMVAERLGWGERRTEDDALVRELFTLLGRIETDQVIFFRDLAEVPAAAAAAPAAEEQLLAPLADAWYEPARLTGEVRAAWVHWLRRWSARAADSGLEDDARRARMNALNPRYVLRNYLAQEAIDAAGNGDPALVYELLDVLRRPYDEQPGKERFAARRPEWARHRAGCSMLSCSS